MMNDLTHPVIAQDDVPPQLIRSQINSIEWWLCRFVSISWWMMVLVMLLLLLMVVYHIVDLLRVRVHKTHCFHVGCGVGVSQKKSR